VSGGESADLRGLAGVLVQGLSTLPGVQAFSDADVQRKLKAAKRPELRACEGDKHCLAELGRLVGASHVVAGEVGELPEGRVVYLEAIDVASEASAGSTTAIFPGDPKLHANEARAAAHRLLSPRSYVGHIGLKIDVAGATLYVDGQRIGKSPLGILTLSVGTHALRITHAQYRDFVRFVDVAFDQTETLDVGLKAYPVVTDEMRQAVSHHVAPREASTPWYRSAWTVAGFATVVLVATVFVAYHSAGGVAHDREVGVGR
jgi:hypothetical protein